MKTPIVTDDPFLLPVEDMLALLNEPYAPALPVEEIVPTLLALLAEVDNNL